MTNDTIDARGIWRGEAMALDRFAHVYAIRHGACDETFRKVYGWTQAALDDAKRRAFPYVPDHS